MKSPEEFQKSVYAKRDRLLAGRRLRRRRLAATAGCLIIGLLAGSVWLQTIVSPESPQWPVEDGSSAAKTVSPSGGRPSAGRTTSPTAEKPTAGETAPAQDTGSTTAESLPQSVGLNSPLEAVIRRRSPQGHAQEARVTDSEALLAVGRLLEALTGVPVTGGEISAPTGVFYEIRVLYPGGRTEEVTLDFEGGRYWSDDGWHCMNGDSGWQALLDNLLCDAG